MNKPLPTPVVVEDGDMYASARKIYPREIDGRFQRLRKAAVFWLLGMFYVFPWINWDGRQLVLFDLPARKFYIFGLTFWPQDFFYLSMLLMMAGFSLFFFTALAGRLWCGYACPQTVWTETFLWMERWTEGTRNQQIKLDAGPWTREKITRKGAKQFLWVTFSLWTGFTFVGFFTPIRELAGGVATLSLGPWETFWMLFYALATYGNAGFLREQVCKYMCPYARFQGAMFDRNTLVISYDTARGEPRGARKKKVEPKSVGLGDCVDCMACVQVCPTGIDIRDGLQYECIACGACIDACDEVMDKMGYARGLVRYTTENALEGRPTRVLRPRVLIYAAILSVLAVAFVWSVATRTPLIVDVLRDRNALYREAADGSVDNVYTLKIMNKDGQAHRYRIVVEGPAGIAPMGGTLEIEVPAQEVATLPVTLRATPGTARGKLDLAFVVVSDTDEAVRYRQETTFFGPF
jgi:cytochrome c oxidase accessory protein FixG